MKSSAIKIVCLFMVLCAGGIAGFFWPPIQIPIPVAATALPSQIPSRVPDFPVLPAELFKGLFEKPQPGLAVVEGNVLPQIVFLLPVGATKAMEEFARAAIQSGLKVENSPDSIINCLLVGSPLKRSKVVSFLGVDNHTSLATIINFHDLFSLLGKRSQKPNQADDNMLGALQNLSSQEMLFAGTSLELTTDVLPIPLDDLQTRILAKAHAKDWKRLPLDGISKQNMALSPMVDQNPLLFQMGQSSIFINTFARQSQNSNVSIMTTVIQRPMAESPWFNVPAVRQILAYAGPDLFKGSLQ